MEIVLSLIAGGVISWVITYAYYRRSSSKAPEWAKPLLSDFTDASQRAERAGLLVSPAQSRSAPEFSFQLVAEEDPALALAGLRIEIEKRLVDLARRHSLSLPHAGVGRLLALLGERGLLSAEETSVLSDMVGLLNLAAHGKRVNPALAQWAIDAGRRLLIGLDRRPVS